MCIRDRDYDIDGLRLDVAYCLDLDFLAELRGLANSIKPEFALMGETPVSYTHLDVYKRQVFRCAFDPQAHRHCHFLPDPAQPAAEP